MAELTVAEWAKQEGISPQAAYKRIKSGRVKLTANGKIDSDEAGKQWDRNKNLRQQLRGAPQQAARPKAPEAPQRADSLADAQRAREWLKVAKDKILLDQLQGSVLPKQEVERAWSAMISAARSRLLLLPDKVAPRVAVISEVLEVRAVLDEAIREALSALSEQEE